LNRPELSTPKTTPAQTMAFLGNEREMDQFMEDFLNGKFDDDSEFSPRQTRASSELSSSKSRSKEGKSKKRSSKENALMDPQQVLRLLETYASVNDSKNANALLGYSLKMETAAPPALPGIGGNGSRRKVNAHNAAA
jgi:hypothetical protein